LNHFTVPCGISNLYLSSNLDVEYTHLRMRLTSVHELTALSPRWKRMGKYRPLDEIIECMFD
jgi:hypothetical protein